MMNLNIYIKPIILVISVIISLFIVHKILKSKNPLWSAIKSSLAGVVALVLVSLTSNYTSVYIPLSLMDIGIASIAGVPGVCMLIIINFIFMH